VTSPPHAHAHFVATEHVPEDAARLSSGEQAAMDAINERVAAGEDLEAIVGFLFESTAPFFPCDRLSLAFLQDDAERAVSHVTQAQYEPVLLDTGYAEDLRGSSLTAVLKTRRLRIIDDLEYYLERKPNSRSTKLLLQEGVRSSLTCPLFVEDRAVGFLFRSSREAGRYGMHEAALHLAVARRLSQAVEKAWRIEQLAQANTAYFEMLGFVSHELKSPVASMVTDARLILDGYLGEVEEPQREKLGQMVRKAQYLLSLVGEYLDLSRIESGELEARFQPWDLRSDVIDVAWDIVRPQVEEKDMQVEFDLEGDFSEVECDGELMKVVAVNLLSNAVKYGNEGGAIRVYGEARDDAAQVTVWNEGPGFPESEKPRLFRKFSRLQTKELAKRKGTGVGLYSAWRIIKLHGGSLWANSEEGAWAEFTFRLPLRQPKTE
jgi:hypothetical protein